MPTLPKIKILRDRVSNINTSSYHAKSISCNPGKGVGGGNI